ncbi:uncharacterized protein LOC118159008 [Oxyura jamaicensis]|uniref:uncharacterized protein LOC118159008 n=1 Tax=Oxyura jamaicensis TaxID=8884 RepID=UPI0015A6F522|nr:uncharacterized protein LOC118159008 [Oxyura jamaicensis]
MGPALGRREPAAVGDGARLQRSGLWLGTSPASHLGLSLQGAGSGPGNSLPPAGADCLGEPKRGEWIWRWQPERAADLAASVPTRGPSRPLAGAAEGPRDGSFPSLLREASGVIWRWWDRAGDAVAFPCPVLLGRIRAQAEVLGCLRPGLSISACIPERLSPRVAPAPGPQESQGPGPALGPPSQVETLRARPGAAQSRQGHLTISHPSPSPRASFRGLIRTGMWSLGPWHPVGTPLGTARWWQSLPPRSHLTHVYRLTYYPCPPAPRFLRSPRFGGAAVCVVAGQGRLLAPAPAGFVLLHITRATYLGFGGVGWGEALRVGGARVRFWGTLLGVALWQLSSV